MTLPTGKSFISYRRTRLDEVKELVASQKERGIPTWQDIEDLRTEPTETELRNVLASNDIANVLLWITPDVGKSSMITKVEVPCAVERHKRQDGFFILPVAAGGLGYEEVGATLGNHSGITELSNWNITKVRSNPVTAEDIRNVSNVVLNQRLSTIHKHLPQGEPLRLVINTRAATGHQPGIALEIDWTHRFAGAQRRSASPCDWQSKLLTALEDISEATQRSASNRKVIASGLASLPSVTALGYHFMATRGIDIAWEQLFTDRSRQIWNLAAERKSSGYEALTTPGRTAADDLAVMVSVNADVEGAVAASRETTGSFRAYVHVKSPEPQQFLESPGEALDVAQLTIEGARAARSMFGIRGRVHLFMAVPAGLAMMIGQLLNTLGPIQTYEHIPVDATGTYESAAVLGSFEGSQVSQGGEDSISL